MGGSKKKASDLKSPGGYNEREEESPPLSGWD